MLNKKTSTNTGDRRSHSQKTQKKQNMNKNTENNAAIENNENKEILKLKEKSGIIGKDAK